VSCATVPGANCAAADANTPSQLAFAGGAAPAEDATTSARARALAPVAARSVSFRIRLPSVGVKRRYHGVWDLKWVQTCPWQFAWKGEPPRPPPVHGNQGGPGAAADRSAGARLHGPPAAAKPPYHSCVIRLNVFGKRRLLATFSANNVQADWNKEAVEAAKNYLDTMPMSKDALIQQLSSSAGDTYTRAQARYAASKVY
jgi:hypothetical protein